MKILKSKLSLLLKCPKYFTHRSFTLKSPSVINAPPYKTMFFGTDNFALECLKKLFLHREKLCTDLQVMCLPPSRRYKQGCPVSQFASDHNLQLHTWNENTTLESFDVGVVVSFGRMIPSDVIEKFNCGMYNIHGSLLPGYRGAAPIARAVENGDDKTGVTMLKISPNKFDVGDVLALSDDITIDNDVTSTELTDRMAVLGADLLVTTLSDLPNKLNSCKPQLMSEGSRAPKITIDDCGVSFEDLTDEEVWNKFRAFGHVTKYQLKATFEGQLVKFVEFKNPKVESFSGDCSSPPGSVVYLKKDKSLAIKCKRGWIKCTKLKMNRPITATDFKNAQIVRRKKMGQKIIVFEPFRDSIDKNKLFKVKQ